MAKRVTEHTTDEWFALTPAARAASIAESNAQLRTAHENAPAYRRRLTQCQRAFDQSNNSAAVDINRNIKLALQLVLQEAKKHFLLKDGDGLVLSKPQILGIIRQYIINDVTKKLKLDQKSEIEIADANQYIELSLGEP
jgi:hypothetical protein